MNVEIVNVNANVELLGLGWFCRAHHLRACVSSSRQLAGWYIIIISVINSLKAINVINSTNVLNPISVINVFSQLMSSSRKLSGLLV